MNKLRLMSREEFFRDAQPSSYFERIAKTISDEEERGEQREPAWLRHARDIAYLSEHSAEDI